MGCFTERVGYEDISEDGSDASLYTRRTFEHLVEGMDHVYSESKATAVNIANEDSLEPNLTPPSSSLTNGS